MQRSRRFFSTCSTMPPRCSGASVSSARANACAKCVLSSTRCSCSVSISTICAAASPASVSTSVGSGSFMLLIHVACLLWQLPRERGGQDIDVARLRHLIAGARLDALVAIAHHRLGGDRDDRQALVALELPDDAHGVE